MGSHKWTKYSGILTINAIKDSIHHRDHDVVKGGSIVPIKDKFIERCPHDMFIHVRFISRGRLAQTVYRVRYMDA